jgi:hypothetical protein
MRQAAEIRGLRPCGALNQESPVEQIIERLQPK